MGNFLSFARTHARRWIFKQIRNQNSNLSLCTFGPDVTSYKVAVIVLGVILGLSLIANVALVIFACTRLRKIQSFFSFQRPTEIIRGISRMLCNELKSFLLLQRRLFRRDKLLCWYGLGIQSAFKSSASRVSPRTHWRSLRRSFGHFGW